MVKNASIFILILLLAGCAGSTPATSSVIENSQLGNSYADLYSESTAPNPPEMMRNGRYTIASTAPTASQRNPLGQIIQVHIPANMTPNTGDAIKYILNRSGYVLCPFDNGTLGQLYDRPLPATQYSLGPISLLNALQVIAGTAWKLKVNEASRSICFTPRQS